MPKRSDMARYDGTFAHGDAPRADLLTESGAAAPRPSRVEAQPALAALDGPARNERGECAISTKAEGVGTRVLRCGSHQSWRRGLPPGRAGSWVFASGRSFLGVRF